MPERASAPTRSAGHEGWPEQQEATDAPRVAGSAGMGGGGDNSSIAAHSVGASDLGFLELTAHMFTKGSALANDEVVTQYSPVREPGLLTMSRANIFLRKKSREIIGTTDKLNGKEASE